MHKPKIDIKHGWLLEEAIEREVRVYDKQFSAPPRRETLEKIARYKESWLSIENPILEGMSNILGIVFEETRIDAFVAYMPHSAGFSDPLSISSHVEVERFADVLTHELIHRIFVHNDTYPLPLIVNVRKEMYPQEKDNSTIMHVPLHAIHKYLYLDVLQQPERLEREMMYLKRVGSTAYLRAWELVEQEGYQNIIERFKAGCVEHARR